MYYLKQDGGDSASRLTLNFFSWLVKLLTVSKWARILSEILGGNNRKKNACCKPQMSAGWLSEQTIIEMKCHGSHGRRPRLLYRSLLTSARFCYEVRAH